METISETPCKAVLRALNKLSGEMSPTTLTLPEQFNNHRLEFSNFDLEISGYHYIIDHYNHDIMIDSVVMYTEEDEIFFTASETEAIAKKIYFMYIFEVSY